MSIPMDHLGDAFEGRFLIDRQIGAGGMSVVYLAHDLEENRQVALKILLPELTASVGADRFLREVQIGAKLSHSHILPMYRSGQAGGLLFYTMPYVEGDSLREKLEREGQLPIDEALEITRQVASALDYAHRQGVVHRDIKPSNILLSEGGALVMDFGIARAIDPEGEEQLTKTGLAMGTPAYMSPEQSEPGARVDGRADQYSLGCVLYEMLAGQPPFHGSSAQVVLARHAKDPVPPLSSARSTVTQPIETVVQTALAKAPADRFRTAAKFADALHMAEQGVTPRGVTPLATQPHTITFWSELKRRRVYQVGAGYLVLAWALAQVLDAVAEPIGISSQLHSGLIWATIGGFPIALVLSWLYDLTPQGIRRTQAVPITPRTGSQFPVKQRLTLTAVIVAVALIGVVAARTGLLGGLFSSRGGLSAPVDLSTVRPRDLDPNDVVVLPFRPSGVDPSQGVAVATLLDAALHGEASEREWDLTTVAGLRSRLGSGSDADLTQDQGLQVAARLRARRLIRGGSIVGTPARITISATLERVPTGTPITTESVQGHPDSLSSLVTRLAALLLHQDWHDAVSRQELARVPTPALEAYRDASRAFSRGDGATAARSAEEALRLHPDFPGAAFMRWRADGSGALKAWELKDRLSERERTWMTVQLGSRFPEEWEGAAEAIEEAEAAFEEHPTWPELADVVGTRLFHEGEYVGRTNVAQQAFNLSVREGDLREEPDYFQLWLLRSRGWAPDTTDLRELADSVLAQTSPPRSTEDSLARYWVAVGMEDTAMLDSLRASGIHELDPKWFRQLNALEGKPGHPGPDALQDFERSVEAHEGLAESTPDYVRVLHFRMDLARVRGQVEEAARLLDTLSRVGGDFAPEVAHGDPWWYLTVPIEGTLVEPGWDAAARWAAQELTARDEEYVGPWFRESDRLCWPELERVRRGVTTRARETSRRLSSLISGRGAGGVCARMLEALVEHEERRGGPAPSLTRLDSLMRRGPRETQRGVANLVIARLYAERGDTARALQAVRRRPYDGDVVGVLPAYLALEARLSAAAGDTARALEAAQHYLRLRLDPDPPLQPQRDSVQALLDSLGTDG